MSPARRGAAAPSHTVDAIVLAPRAGHLAVLVLRGGKGAPQLPWAAPRAGEALLPTAKQLVRRSAGAEAGWLEQVGAFGDGARHPAAAAVSVGFVGVLSAPAAEGKLAPGADWVPVDEAGLGGRHATMLAAAQALVRLRLDHAPIAFKLLPPTFTLSDLQGMYELLLGWPLHKASFRRSLQAAWLVEPTDAWRSEGRGRPAQLYRYAPRKRRAGRRGVRFDLLAT